MQTILSTAGTGLWSTQAKPVLITDITMPYVNDERDFGELCAHFNVAYWDVSTDGLIYTDPVFLAGLKQWLTAHGLAGADVSYSEQGMQGMDYVSLDVGAEFIASWQAKFGELTV